MSELVAPTPSKKVAISTAYLLVFTIAALVGYAGLYLSPLQFLVATVGLLLVAIALVKTEFAIVLLVVIAPLANIKVNLGPIPLDVVTICMGLIILSYMIHNAGKRNSSTATPFTWAFLAFFIISAISMVIAPSMVEAATTFMRFAGYFLLVAVIGRSVKSRETLTWILVLMVAAGAVTALYGIYQYIYIPDSSAKIGVYGLGQDVLARAGSTFGNSNFYAEYLVLIVPIGLALTIGSRNWFRRTIIGSATILLFIALVLTYTRGSWLGAAIGIVLMSLLTEAWLFWVWAGLFAVALVAAPGVANRVASMADMSGGTAGFRMRLWHIAYGIIREHPLIGIGIGNYYEAFTNYIFKHPESSVGWVIYGAHNSYLTLFAETGVFGILSFIAIILISIRYGLFLAHAKAQDKYLSWINSALFAGVVGFAINSLTSNSFHHPQGAVFFWVALGLQVAIGNMAAEPTGVQTSPIVIGSYILRPFRTSLASFRAAAASHQIKRITARIGGSWQESRLAAFFCKEPSQINLLSGSRAYQPVIAALEKFRGAVENSFFYAVTGGIVARPVVMALVFVMAAVMLRMLAGAVT
ncbi:MAG TPA: O-antigen ligase family protein [Candidatus Aquicultor sp.]